MTKLLGKTIKYVLITLASPVVLFFLLAILIYIPPVQNFAVQRASEMLSEEMDMDIRIERVRLAFPLDFALHNAIAIQNGDTLLDARSLRVEVKLLPLFKGRADIEGIALYNTKIDTKSYISDTHIKGSLKEFSASAHGVDWNEESVHIDQACLFGANVSIALSDTAAPDTSSTAINWKIIVERADIKESSLSLSLPGDSMRIGANIGEAALREGCFDLGRPYYGAKKVWLREVGIDYNLPFETTIEGFDPNHIALKDIVLNLQNFSYDEKAVLRADLRQLYAREKCGLLLHELSGEILMDSLRLQVPALKLRTPHSNIDADINLDWRAFTEGKGGDCKVFLDATIGYDDAMNLAKGFVDKSILAAYPKKPALIKAMLAGNVDKLFCEELSAELPGIAGFSAKGSGEHLLSEKRRGNIGFDLRTSNLAFVRRLLPAEINKTIAIPDQMTARGNAAVNGSHYNGDAKLHLAEGKLEARISGNLKGESYDLSAQAEHLPLGTLLPGNGLGNFSGEITARGKGYDPYGKKTVLNARAKVKKFAYEQWNLDSIGFDAEVKNQRATAKFTSHNDLLEADGRISAILDGCINTRLDADIPMLNLGMFTESEDTITMGLSVGISAYAEKDFSAFSTDGSLENIYFVTPRRSFTSRDIDFDLATGPEHTHADIDAGDLSLRLLAQADINSLLEQITVFTDSLTAQIERKRIEQDSLKDLLPTMDIDLRAGKDNALSNILRVKGITYDHALFSLNTAPSEGVTGDTRIQLLKTGALQLDSIDLDILQDTAGVKINGLVKNYLKGNPNKFEAKMNAYLHTKGVGVSMKFLDNNRKTGMDIGMHADFEEDGIRVGLTPQHPILAYRKFTVNTDNYVLLKNDSTLFADIDLLADDGTGLKFYSQPADSTNDITLSLNRINLAELSQVIPYMPHLGGMLNGDAHLIRNLSDKSITAMAMLSAEQLMFEDVALGNVGADVTFMPKIGGEYYASAFVTAEETDVLECSGTYFDREGGYFSGEAFLHDFPLKLVNGFLVGTDVALDGNVAGEFSVDGSLEEPRMNGSVNFKKAHVYSDVYGFKFRMDEDAVVLKENKLTFDKFELFSTGKQPLVVDGYMNLDAGMKLNFDMSARTFELINTKKNPKSLVFGKVYSDFDGTLRGTLDNMLIRGKLEILDRTDMTYILKDSPLSADNRLKELVQFVDFSDTAVAEKQIAAASGMDLTLNIGISDAARFHCNLSEDGKNYVDLEGGGNLTMRLTQQGEMRLTGRFTANSGEMKYALPVIPLKTFKLTQGSYVDFTGDVLNPTLNIAAKERVKSVVTENDVPRSVTFDVGVALTKPLEDMGLEFTIEAPEDLSVQNQLAAMSPEQRGKTAVAMLATGMYLTDDMQSMGTSGFKATNALNAFLQSEIQNIAGSALRTIDINLGVESGTSSAGTATTDYSFQFSKRFWGDRISVIIGGKVSTGQDAEYSAESFINNIAVEYRLDKSASRYVRVFYDRNHQDALEGQITEGGVGLVLRRKTDRLGELFIFRSPKKNKVKANETH